MEAKANFLGFLLKPAYDKDYKYEVYDKESGKFICRLNKKNRMNYWELLHKYGFKLAEKYTSNFYEKNKYLIDNKVNIPTLTYLIMYNGYMSLESLYKRDYLNKNFLEENYTELNIRDLEIITKWRTAKTRY